MGYGLLAGLFWGLDTVIIGVALAMSPFLDTTQAIFLSPFISTFIHDFFSSIWMLGYMGIKKQYKNVLTALKSRSGKFIMLAALVGGPVGMTGYVLSIKYIGASYTAIISSLFPALGAFFAYVFLKEKMKPYQLAGLAVSILGVIALGYTPSGSAGDNMLIGIVFALVCVVGWASEAVIIAYGLKDPDITDDQALQIRQVTSALAYAVIILPLLGGWGLTIDIFTKPTVLFIMASAVFGTVSYLFYYRAIGRIGASKAMALNITYSAWAVIFGVVFLKESMTPGDILFGIIIIAGSVIAAADFKEMFASSKKKENMA